MKNYINSIDCFDFDEDFESGSDQQRLLRAAQHVNALFKARGWEAKLTPGVLAAAFQLNDEQDKEAIIAETRNFFLHRAILIPDGLETLPRTWLESIGQVLLGTLKPHWDHIPYMITSLRLCNSMLCVSFAQEIEPREPPHTTYWDRLRITLNSGLKPNLWTCLTAVERLAIWANRPDLREDLLGFSPCMQLNSN